MPEWTLLVSNSISGGSEIFDWMIKISETSAEQASASNYNAPHACEASYKWYSYIEQWAWHWHWRDCPHHCWRCICRDPRPVLRLRSASDSDCAPLSSHCSALLLPDHEKIFHIGLFGKYLMIFHLFCPVNVRRRISRSFTPEFNMFSFLHHKVAIRRVSLDAGRNWNNINY